MYQFSKREKVLLFVLALVAVVAGGFLLLLNPALEQRLVSKTEPLYRLAADLCIKGDEIPAEAAWSEYLQMPQVYEDWFVERSKTMGTF